jgi:hypothetical protein
MFADIERRSTLTDWSVETVTVSVALPAISASLLPSGTPCDQLAAVPQSPVVPSAQLRTTVGSGP